MRVAWRRAGHCPCRNVWLGVFLREPESIPDWVLDLDRKGGNWEVWPEDLRVREMPGAAVEVGR